MPVSVGSAGVHRTGLLREAVSRRRGAPFRLTTHDPQRDLMPMMRRHLGHLCCASRTAFQFQQNGTHTPSGANCTRRTSTLYYTVLHVHARTVLSKRWQRKLIGTSYESTQGCLCFKHDVLNICLKHSFKRMFKRSLFKTYYVLNIV